MTQDKLHEHSDNSRMSVSSHNSSASCSSLVSRDSMAPIRPSTPRDPGSAPNSRTCSFKNKPRPKELDIGTRRTRTNSVPFDAPIMLSVSYDDIDHRGENGGGAISRQRSFKKTSKGIINRGDSFKKKSNNNMATGTTDPYFRHRTHSGSDSVHSKSSANPSYFRVVMLGTVGTGKTSLTRQFMTSEYMGASDTPEGLPEKMVSVLLDGEESTMEFIDLEGRQTALEVMNVDAYVVVYSITMKDTFDAAVEQLYKLRHEYGSDRAIILVANKIDLVRKRAVKAEEARSVAMMYDSKYIETSAALNHHVDELLVGILSQIRLKLKVPPTPTNKSFKKGKKKSRGPFGLLSKLFKRQSQKSKSCDNLYVL